MESKLEVLRKFRDPAQTQFPVEIPGETIPELIKGCGIKHDRGLDLSSIKTHNVDKNGMCQLLRHPGGMVVGEADELVLSDGKQLPHISDVVTLMRLEPEFPLLVIVPGASVVHRGVKCSLAIHATKEGLFMHAFSYTSRVNGEAFQILARCA